MDHKRACSSLESRGGMVKKAALDRPSRKRKQRSIASGAARGGATLNRRANAKSLAEDMSILPVVDAKSTGTVGEMPSA